MLELKLNIFIKNERGASMKIIDPAYFCFMAEAEGLDNLITTRTAKINAAINEFIAYLCCDFRVFVYELICG
jgi:hypothetical protein